MNMVANRVRMFSTKCKSYIEQKASKIGDKTIMPTSYKDYNEKDSVLSKMQKVSTSKYNRKMPKDYYINEGEKKISNQSKGRKNLVYKTSKFRLLKAIEDSCAKSQYVSTSHIHKDIKVRQNEASIKSETKAQLLNKIPKLKNLSSLSSLNSKTPYSCISMSVRGIKEKVQRESINKSSSKKSITSRIDLKSSNTTSSSVYK